MTLNVELLALGGVTGLAYALLACGIVLVFRAARVINLAHGQIGALAAAFLARLALDYQWNFVVACIVAVAAGAALGAMVELTVVRRLFEAPRVILLIATIGVAQLLLMVETVLPAPRQQARFPSPIDRQFVIGNLVLRSEHFMTLAIVPAAVVGLGLFLAWTPFGVSIRAAAQNPDAALLAAIDTRRVSTVVWAVAGALATLSVVLIIPLRSGLVGGTAVVLAPDLLLRALAAALVGRLVSIPLTLVGGIAVGVVEAVMFANVAHRGAADAMLFVAVLGLLFVVSRRQPSEEAPWSVAQLGRPIDTSGRPPWLRRLPLIARAVGLLVAAALPWLFTSSGALFGFSTVLIYAMIALSVTVLTGWAGLLSLGQFAFVGFGAMLTARAVSSGASFAVAVVLATLFGVVSAVLIGFPAVRVRGLFLAISTLAFAVAAHRYFFVHDWVTGSETRARLPRPELFGLDLSSQRTYYYLTLGCVVAVMALVVRLRRSGVARKMIAVRDNDRAAASFGSGLRASKLTAFGVSGGIAAFAGALLGGLHVQYSYELFTPGRSLEVVAVAVIGGLGSVIGALLGAIYVVGLPVLFDGSATVGFLTSSVGLLVLLLYFPAGLAGLVEQARHALIRRFGSNVEVERAAPGAVPMLRVHDAEAAVRADGEPALSISGISVQFGGLRALDEVSVEVRQNETVGLIGSNGAGKSTLIDVVSGFVTPNSGMVALHGDDITTWSPQRRAAAGLGRVFQDARLFPGLTVQETVQLALEIGAPTRLGHVLLGTMRGRRTERAQVTRALEHIDQFGLGDYASLTISELSTGTRRVVELTCLVAQQPRVLLLDEPTAGLAQRETEAFAPLIESVRSVLAASILIIEHDMPLVMSISDRVYCLSAGRRIADGDPGRVRSDPAVVAAYLGTDDRVIQRSGSLG